VSPETAEQVTIDGHLGKNRSDIVGEPSTALFQRPESTLFLRVNPAAVADESTMRDMIKRISEFANNIRSFVCS